MKITAIDTGIVCKLVDENGNCIDKKDSKQSCIFTNLKKMQTYIKKHKIKVDTYKFNDSL